MKLTFYNAACEQCSGFVCHGRVTWVFFHARDCLLHKFLWLLSFFLTCLFTGAYVTVCVHMCVLEGTGSTNADIRRGHAQSSDVPTKCQSSLRSR